MSRYLGLKNVSLMGPMLVCLLLPGIGLGQSAQSPLYVVSIGISSYRQSSLDKGVRYAAKDAQDIVQTLRAQDGKLFSTVESVLLVNQEATRDKVAEALNWLKNKSRPDAYCLVFLAGHGGGDGLGYYSALLHDSHPLLPSTFLSGQTLRDNLQGMKGKRLLVLDTCHAGAFQGAGADFLTWAACMAQEKSHEQPNLQNGYFTRAFLEGLQGMADTNHDGTVTLAELDAYIAERLQVLSGGQQQTTMYRPATLPSRLPLAFVTR